MDPITIAIIAIAAAVGLVLIGALAFGLFKLYQFQKGKQVKEDNLELRNESKPLTSEQVIDKEYNNFLSECIVKLTAYLCNKRVMHEGYDIITTRAFQNTITQNFLDENGDNSLKSSLKSKPYVDGEVEVDKEYSAKKTVEVEIAHTDTGGTSKLPVEFSFVFHKGDKLPTRGMAPVIRITSDHNHNTVQFILEPPRAKN